MSAPKREFVVEYWNGGDEPERVVVCADDGPFIGPRGELYFKGNSPLFNRDAWVSCVECEKSKLQ